MRSDRGVFVPFVAAFAALLVASCSQGSTGVAGGGADDAKAIVPAGPASTVNSEPATEDIRLEAAIRGAKNAVFLTPEDIQSLERLICRTAVRPEIERSVREFLDGSADMGGLSFSFTDDEVVALIGVMEEMSCPQMNT